MSVTFSLSHLHVDYVGIFFANFGPLLFIALSHLGQRIRRNVLKSSFDTPSRHIGFEILEPSGSWSPDGTLNMSRNTSDCSWRLRLGTLKRHPFTFKVKRCADEDLCFMLEIGPTRNTTVSKKNAESNSTSLPSTSALVLSCISLAAMSLPIGDSCTLVSP